MSIESKVSLVNHNALTAWVVGVCAILGQDHFWVIGDPACTWGSEEPELPTEVFKHRPLAEGPSIWGTPTRMDLSDYLTVGDYKTREE